MDIRERVEKSFNGFLNAFGFRLKSSIVDERHFGNSILEFESHEVLLRFVTDRDDLFIDVDCNPSVSHWRSFGFLLEQRGYPLDALTEKTDAEMAAMLQNEFTGLVEWLRTHPANSGS